MKNLFSEYYDIPEQTYKDIWGKALIVFDTNLLLNLYRYTTDTRDNILEVMAKVPDRIWIPYQVGWEYFNNRLNVINGVSGGYDAIKKLITTLKNNFEKHLNDNYKHHPYIDRNVLRDLYNKDVIAPIITQLDEWKKNDPKYADNDVIWEKLTTLFDGKVGEDFSTEKLYNLYKEGEIRYAHQVPPGFMDLPQKKDQGERHLYGDLIVWKQTIEKAKQSKCDVIFVTDDKKNDWFEPKVNGNRTGARKELLREFSKETEGQKVLIYNQEKFLNYANEYLQAQVKEESIKEVKDVSTAEGEKIKAARKRTEEILQRYGVLGDNLARVVNPTAVTAVTWPHIKENFGLSTSVASQLQAILEQQKSVSAWGETMSTASKVDEVLKANPFIGTTELISQIARQTNTEANSVSKTLSSLLSSEAILEAVKKKDE